MKNWNVSPKLLYFEKVILHNVSKFASEVKSKPFIEVYDVRNNSIVTYIF